MTLETWRLAWCVAWRHWKVYRKDLVANLSPTVADPALFILAFGFGLGGYISEIGGHSYVAFMAPGLAISTVLFTSFFETSYGFYFRMTFDSIYKAMLTTPVEVNDILLGEYLWVTLKSIAMTSGVTAVLWAFGIVSTPWALGIPLVAILVAPACASLGLIATSMISNMHQFQAIYAWVIAPIFFLSGAFYPLSDLHPALYVAAHFSPMAHGVELAQALFWNQDLWATCQVHIPILVIMDVVLVAVAVRRIRPLLAG